MADLTGQQLGNYRLIRLLGMGGYAEVYLGEHVRLNTQAAIKVLHTRLANSEEVEIFQNEGRTIARLIHPHIIRVFDFDVENDIPFMVMDYAPHGTLRIRHPRGTRLPLPTVISYVQQVAGALQYAHDHQLVHRDIKPENMLLGRSDEVLLSDFGTAMAAQTTGYQTSLQEVIGTVSYMAPEQFEGKGRPASDQYALAIVVYEWLTGEVPFRGTGTQVAIQHTITPPPLLHEKVPGISPQVEQVVMRALAKDHHQRFPRVQDFSDALTQAIQAKQSYYNAPTVTSATIATPDPATLPTVQAPVVQEQSQPATSAPNPAMKPSPLARDTATSDAAHAPSPIPVQAPAEGIVQPHSQYVPINPSPAAPVYQPPVQQPPVAPTYQRPAQQRRGGAVWLVLLLLVLLLVAGGSLVWFLIPRITGTAPTSSTLPNVAGFYTGNLLNTTVNVPATMTLTIEQNQDRIHGFFKVGPPLHGSNSYVGSVNTNGHIQFTVESALGNAPLFFSGSVQSDGSLVGTYCSLDNNGQCSPNAGGAGTWHVAKQ